MKNFLSLKLKYFLKQEQGSMQKKEILLNACISMMKLFVILLAVAMSTNYMNIRKYLSLQNSANWLVRLLVGIIEYLIIVFAIILIYAIAVTLIETFII
jgi:hypothetical protein